MFFGNLFSVFFHLAFKLNFEHLSPCAAPNPVTNNRVNSAVPNTNNVNKNELVLKHLAAEASQYMTYNWSGIQEAESKYQIYLASQRKACKVFIICYFCITDNFYTFELLMT